MRILIGIIIILLSCKSYETEKAKAIKNTKIVHERKERKKA